ncbi:hypothetical protein ACIGCK_03820 [Microbacterium sp. NPDC078428]|uniref:Uncharacterized protein n=1 Tax=Microbacterium limosum TaxID=3079935 RepID=A0AAU0MK71_9MICO|nr:hypothetical protein [Microbacterium sp. Y20]WOQ70370.1 hypothetical protein RYJ27_03950 [Microbacterium sp. Y20]
MSEQSPRPDLLSAIEVIEDQPLASRADAYAGLHEELTRLLDGAGGIGETRRDRP